MDNTNKCSHALDYIFTTVKLQQNAPIIIKLIEEIIEKIAQLARKASNLCLVCHKFNAFLTN